MTVDDLITRLIAWLPAQLVDLHLESAGGTYGPPVLVYGVLPPKRAPSEPQPPLIIVRPVSGTDTDDGSRIVVRFLVETYSEDQAGLRDQVNVLQRLRSALAGQRTLGPFHLELPMQWQLFDEQPQPIWAAYLTTTWTQPAIEWMGATE
jgi:hypothetical protein